jgi:hypothetical protein
MVEMEKPNRLDVAKAAFGGLLFAVRFRDTYYPFICCPRSMPVFRLIRCSPAQALHLMTSYSLFGTSSSASNQCCTLVFVAGQVKTVGAIYR